MRAGCSKFLFFGGGKRDRTADLLHAIQARILADTMAYANFVQNSRRFRASIDQEVTAFRSVSFGHFFRAS